MYQGPYANIGTLKKIRDELKRNGKRKIKLFMPPQNRETLESMGVKIIQGSIPMFGINFSLRKHLNHRTDADIINSTLELMSPGTCPCADVVMMAADAGVIEESEEVLAMAGTERGL